MSHSPLIWIVAGEDSGDQHGAALARALLAENPELRIAGLGGPRMREAGVEVAADLTRMAATGLVEVLGKVPFFFRLLRETAARIRAARPAAAVLIDFPDFNLRLAERVGGDVPVVYYVAPQLWAWREGRIKAFRASVRKALVIFPFEEPFYRDRGVDAAFVGHPLVEAIAAEKGTDLRAELGVEKGRPLIGLLPGSRGGEFARHAGLFAEAARILARGWPEALFVLSVSRAAPGGAERAFEGMPFPLKVLRGRGRDILSAADAALVASGTVTVEAMLLGCPFVAAYRTNALTYAILKRMVKVEAIAMPNLLAGRKIVPELVQADATPEALARSLLEIARDGARRAAMRRDLAETAAKLGGPGASARAAAEILKIMRQGHGG